MNYAYDLHIHSALSPCADNEMTPNNIVNMAVLKGLDVIALTDHNSGANLEAVGRCAEKAGLLFIPGMEVETAEEVHLVCLLPDIANALELNGQISGALPAIANREDIFGRQLIMDENDIVTGEEKQMLITAACLTVDEVCRRVNRLGGVVIPAHVDRSSYSILSNLGMVPKNLPVGNLEISRSCDQYLFRTTRPELDHYNLIKSSDAHSLEDILERESFLDLRSLSVQALLEALK